MGAWGLGSFENDDAMDWVGEVEEDGSLRPVRRALDSALSADADFGISGEAELGVAAAEVVAAMQGKPSDGLPEELRTWLEGRPWQRRGLLGRVFGKPGGASSDHAPAEIVEPLAAKAREVVNRVMRDEGMRDRFMNAADIAAWETGLRGLLGRLGDGSA